MHILLSEPFESKLHIPCPPFLNNSMYFFRTFTYNHSTITKILKNKHKIILYTFYIQILPTVPENVLYCNFSW